MQGIPAITVFDKILKLDALELTGAGRTLKMEKFLVKVVYVLSSDCE
jgi:hypothetical protein